MLLMVPKCSLCYAFWFPIFFFFFSFFEFEELAKRLREAMGKTSIFLFSLL